MDYYGLMKSPRLFFRLSALTLALCATGVWAQAPAANPNPETPVNSAMDGELLYELLLGEFNVRAGEAGPGYSLILDAARKTNDPRLYQRAVEIALQARSGEAALQAARTWKQALPNSRDANRAVLQILVALNRLGDTVDLLKTEVNLTEAKERPLAIALLPRYFVRVSDKKQAASVVEQGLADQLANPQTGPTAWATVGRLRLAAEDNAGAMEAARRGHALNERAESPALLALELVDPKEPAAEPIVRRVLELAPLPELRMGYARVLLEGQRYGEATQQLQQLTASRPDFTEAWLVLGSLQVQDNQLAPAEASLRRYIDMAQAQPPSEERSRGLSQAYLAMAQLAEKRKDYAAAERWLNSIENAKELIAAQSRRASILAHQGRMAQARQLIRELPERSPADARMKLLAEVQLLRDNRQYQAAYDLLAGARQREPKDTDLAYDQAMLADKLGRHDEMERLLRQIIQDKPDSHNAYNALGYSLAERNTRLAESRQLIQKALTLAPGDPFISDSLGWVEYRMGNKAEALRVLDAAYKAKPDPEIAAHLGEVLWSLGQRERATAIWREGLLMASDNETLRDTLKRFKVKP